jgi:hypothetical protein
LRVRERRCPGAIASKCPLAALQRHVLRKWLHSPERLEIWVRREYKSSITFKFLSLQM